MSKHPEDEKSKPRGVLETTPPLGRYDEFSVYETTLHLSRSMGQLTEKVSHLGRAIEDHSEKLEKIGKDVHGAKVGFWVGVSLIGVAMTFLGWLIQTALSALRVMMSSQ